MNILFVGNHSTPATSESQYVVVLRSMGHNVHCVQENSCNKEQLLSHLLYVDLFVWISTHGWHIQGIEDVLYAYRTKNIPIITWHLDIWMGLQRESEMKLPYFTVDHFFTVDKLMADHLNNNTQTKGHYLPPASFDELTYIGEPDREKYPHDIIFTGAYWYHLEYKYRPTLIDWLHATYGDRFAHYGSGGRAQVRGHELNKLYASAKIVIGDTLCKDFTYPWYFSDRLTSVLGQGGFMIFPYIKGLEDMYKLGSEIVPYEYNNFSELKFLIDLFLNDSMQDRRIEIRNASHERTKQQHLFSHRWKTILKTVFP